MNFHLKNGDPSAPVTRGEFNEAMQMIASAFEKVATKDDLKRFVTKNDLKKQLEKYATKNDLNDVKMELKQDISRLETKLDEKLDVLIEKIDALVENRAIELGAAKDEHVQLLDQKVANHETRIEALEKV